MVGIQNATEIINLHEVTWATCGFWVEVSDLHIYPKIALPK